ncbi:hypothetical protein [Ferroplasma sp.]|nr:hypothetical protein [Ferroplasma sp.]
MWINSKYDGRKSRKFPLATEEDFTVSSEKGIELPVIIKLYRDI